MWKDYQILLRLKIKFEATCTSFAMNIEKKIIKKKNNQMTHADENICTYSTFYDQRSSSGWFPLTKRIHNYTVSVTLTYFQGHRIYPNRRQEVICYSL